MPTKNGRLTAAEMRAKLARQSKSLATIRKKARASAQDVGAPVITGVVMRQVVQLVAGFLPKIPGLTGQNRIALVYGLASMVAPTMTKDKAMGRAWRDAALNLAGASIDVMALASTAMSWAAPKGGARARLGQAVPVAQLRAPQSLPSFNTNNINARSRARSRFAA